MKFAMRKEPERAGAKGNLVRRFGGDQRGLAAIEFAMIFPLMILLFLGSVEFSQGLTVDRRVTQVASSTADLVAQFEQLSSADVDDIIDIGQLLLGGFDTSELKVTIISVSTDADGDATVDWARNEAGADGGYTAGEDYTALPDDLLGPLSSVIIAKASYNFVPTVGTFLKEGIELSETFYLRPRRSLKVALVNG